MRKAEKISKDYVAEILNNQLENFDPCRTTIDNVKIVITHYYHPDYNCTIATIERADEDNSDDINFEEYNELGVFPLYTPIQEIFTPEVLMQFEGRIVEIYSDDN